MESSEEIKKQMDSSLREIVIRQKALSILSKTTPRPEESEAFAALSNLMVAGFQEAGKEAQRQGLSPVKFLHTIMIAASGFYVQAMEEVFKMMDEAGIEALEGQGLDIAGEMAAILSKNSSDAAKEQGHMFTPKATEEIVFLQMKTNDVKH